MAVSTAAGIWEDAIVICLFALGPALFIYALIYLLGSLVPKTPLPTHTHLYTHKQTHA